MLLTVNVIFKCIILLPKVCYIFFDLTLLYCYDLNDSLKRKMVSTFVIKMRQKLNASRLSYTTVEKGWDNWPIGIELLLWPRQRSWVHLIRQKLRIHRAKMDSLLRVAVFVNLRWEKRVIRPSSFYVHSLCSAQLLQVNL